MALDSPLHLRQTERFIQERPVNILIRRRTKVATENGGFTMSNPTLLPPQEVRKVGARSEEPITTSDGRTVVPTAAVIGLPSVDIQVSDKFEIDDVMHEVVTVSRLPEWRVSAEVIEYAEG